MLALLEPGQAEKWAAVRSADLPNPLTGSDLTLLIRWLFEEMAGGRPTGPSSGSSPGPNGTATTSTDDSSSKLAEASAG